jgi:hypothetical protein
MSVNNQTNLRSNTSLTLSFFSASQYHHYSRHDDVERHGTTTTTSTLCSQGMMFHKAYAFNQDITDWDVSKGTNFVSGLGA